MPQAFSGDWSEGQRTEKVYEEDFRYVKELSFAERLKIATVAPIIDCGFGISGQGDYLLHGHDILTNLDSFIMGFRLGANFAYEAFISTETPFQDLLKE